MTRYTAAFWALERRGPVYLCYCTRAGRLAASTPHCSNGQVVYSGKHRHLIEEERVRLAQTRCPAWRLIAPNQEISFADGLQGTYRENLFRDRGDSILHRSDGVYTYQLAVMCDGRDMEVTQVVRGRDLLDSTLWQLYPYGLPGLTPSEFYCAPLLLAPDGRRLSKREHDLDTGALWKRFTSAELAGRLAFWARRTNRPELVIPTELVGCFKRKNVLRGDITVEQLQEQKGAGRSVPTRPFAVRGVHYPGVTTHLRQ